MDSSDSDDFNFIFFTTVMAIAAFADKKSKKAKEASRAAMVELEKSTGISGGGGGNSSRSRFKVVNAGPDDTIPLKLKRRRVVLPRPDYAEAPWSRMLRQEGKSLEDHKSTEASSFLRLFRVPYAFFVKLVSLAKTRKWFPIAQIDVSGRPCIPVELKAREFAAAAAASSSSFCCIVLLSIPRIYSSSSYPLLIFPQNIFRI